MAALWIASFFLLSNTTSACLDEKTKPRVDIVDRQLDLYIDGVKTGIIATVSIQGYEYCNATDFRYSIAWMKLDAKAKKITIRSDFGVGSVNELIEPQDEYTFDGEVFGKGKKKKLNFNLLKGKSGRWELTANEKLMVYETGTDGGRETKEINIELRRREQSSLPGGYKVSSSGLSVLGDKYVTADKDEP